MKVKFYVDLTFGILENDMFPLVDLWYNDERILLYPLQRFLNRFPELSPTGMKKYGVDEYIKDYQRGTHYLTMETFFCIVMDSMQIKRPTKFLKLGECYFTARPTILTYCDLTTGSYVGLRKSLISHSIPFVMTCPF